MMRDNIQHKIFNMRLDLSNESSVQKSMSVQMMAKREKAIKFIEELDSLPVSQFEQSNIISMEDINSARSSIAGYFGKSKDGRRRIWANMWDKDERIYYSFLGPINDVVDVRCVTRRTPSIILACTELISITGLAEEPHSKKCGSPDSAHLPTSSHCIAILKS